MSPEKDAGSGISKVSPSLVKRFPFSGKPLFSFCGKNTVEVREMDELKKNREQLE